MGGCVKSDVKQCEKMKLLLSGLLLASLYLSSWSVSSTDTLVLTQTPDVSVREGDTFNITCCFPGTYPRIRLSWWKNQTEMKGEVVNQTQESNFCLILTFFKITTKDSGRYICKVFIEVPTHSVVSGNGTVISVMKKDDGEDNTDHGDSQGTSGSSWMDVLIFSLRCLPLLVLLILFFYLNNRFIKTQQHKAAALENTSPSARRGEEDQEEEEREEDRETLYENLYLSRHL